ncbi:hypothetical protein [Chitinophaga vietnamensis]|uniref:hypothetical protein n=1 Tax=Chitinophaga vietnamensis TaxID=2593957 RepID=UPI00117761AF|nr:hypothetical protein [Chitinophaga vietnamensis]
MRNLLIICLIAAAANVHAQNPVNPKTPALSDQQTSQIKEINATFIKAAQAVRTDKQLSADDKKTKLEELHFNREDKIKSVLTPDQYASWQQKHLAATSMMAEKQAQNAQRLTPKTQDQLGITRAEAQQVKSINSNYKSQIKAIKTDNSLSREDRKMKIDSLHSQQNNELKTALGDEKYARYQAWNTDRKAREKELRKKQDRQLPGKN